MHTDKRVAGEYNKIIIKRILMCTTIKQTSASWFPWKVETRETYLQKITFLLPQGFKLYRKKNLSRATTARRTVSPHSHNKVMPQKNPESLPKTMTISNK
jgi:hypothetical protein